MHFFLFIFLIASSLALEGQMLLASSELKDATAAQQALQQKYDREVELSRRDVQEI